MPHRRKKGEFTAQTLRMLMAYSVMALVLVLCLMFLSPMLRFGPLSLYFFWSGLGFLSGCALSTLSTLGFLYNKRWR